MELPRMWGRLGNVSHPAFQLWFMVQTMAGESLSAESIKYVPKGEHPHA